MSQTAEVESSPVDQTVGLPHSLSPSYSELDGKTMDQKDPEAFFETDDDDDDDESWTEYVAVPPDGGWGWVVVFASFMANLVVDGISYSFGIFLTEFQGYYDSTQGLAAMVGSLLTGCYLVAGPVVGGLVNKYGCRAIMMVGAFIGMGAFMVSVWAPTLTMLMISYGIVGGIGFGFIYLPAIVHVGYYFEKKRALATGIAVAGSGVGTFIFAPFSVALLNNYGWKGSLWILAGLILNCAVFGMLLRPLKPKKNLDDLNKKLEDEAENLKLNVASQLSISNGGSLPSVNRKQTSPNYSTRTLPKEINYETAGLKKLAMLRSAVSGSSHGAEDIQLELVGVSPAQLHSLEEESDGAVRLSLTPVTPNATPKLAHTPSAHVQNGSIRNAESHSRPLLNRPHSRMSVRSYVSSMQHLAVVPAGASLSAHDLGTVDPEDFSRPLYRRDIFFSGSVLHLPAFAGSCQNVGKYLESTISVPLTSGDLVGGEPHAEHCSWLPGPIRHVFCEMIDVRLLREPVMVLLCLSNIFGMLGFYVPFVYLNNRAEVYGVTPERASFLLSIIGITNTVGRVIFGWVSDRGWVSALTINNACLLICGFLTLLVPFLTNYSTMAAYSAIFGFLISAYISLTSIILVDYLGLEQLTNSFGLLILSRGVSAMVGSPLAGAVYDATKSYNDSFYFGGGLILVAGLVSCAIPIVYRIQSCVNSPEPKKKLPNSVQLNTDQQGNAL